jgi:hypothetical protein
MQFVVATSVQRAVRPVLKVSLALVILFLLTEGFCYLGSLAAGAVNFDVGPSTGAYLTGFSESEERPPVSFRWTGKKASIDIPLTGSSTSSDRVDGGKLTIRYARFLEGYARAQVYVSGRPATSFRARSGRFRTHTVPLGFEEEPIRVEIVTEDPDSTRLGIAIDWIRLEGARWKLPLANVSPRLLVAGVFVLSLLSGFGVLGALVAGLATGAAESVWFSFAPFGMAHVNSKVVIAGLVLTGIVAAFARNKPFARWLGFIFLTGYMLKASGIFHPSYFYPDVRNHRRYTRFFADAEGTIPERGVVAQIKVQTAYPRRIGDKDYVFPYSPLFFVPFSWLPQERDLVEDALKHVCLAAGAAEVVLVFWLGALLFGGNVAAMAALLAAFLPPMYSRLFLAMYPTIAGHLLDVAAIAAAAALAARPESLRRLAIFGAAALVSFLIYISSLFNLSAFAGAFALLNRRLTLRVLGVCVGAALVTIALLYSSFTAAFFREILPASMESDRPGGGVSAASGLARSSGRLVLFYGYGFIALTLAGTALARRRCEPHAWRTFLAYGLSFVMLAVLRGVSSGLFKDLKEILYVGPFIAVASGASLATLAERGRTGKIAVILIIGGLIAFWSGKFGEYFSAYASLAGLDEVL